MPTEPFAVERKLCFLAPSANRPPIICPRSFPALAQFPSNAKPSSRAAYLFTYSGPLTRKDFEKALDNTEKLLSTHSDGPFFCGSQLSAADVSWAPFLERYAAQVSLAD